MTKEQILQDFTKIVIELRDEFIEKKGGITAEFSTSPEHLLEKMEILAKHNINTEYFGGYWYMFPCDTCKGYNNETPIHVMVIDTKVCKDYVAGGNLKRAVEKNEALEEIIKEKDRLLDSGILVSPIDLKIIVNLAIEQEKDKCVHEKSETTLFLSNVVDEHFEQQDESSELVTDETICAKLKEIERLDSIISQRKRELGLVEQLFGTMIPVDVKALQGLPDGVLDNSHGFIPDEIKGIKYLETKM